MWYAALATDYDGTLATDGSVSADIVNTLWNFKKSGRRLIMITGRRLQDLFEVFPDVTMFDLLVCENGAVLYEPATKEVIPIAPAPPKAFVERLRENGVTPLEVGESIIATWLPNEHVVLESIQALGLEHQVIFNKGAVMVLPPGVNKASGLAAALRRLNLSAHNVVGVGDAQNDLSFLTACECSVAVDNALPSVKEAADLILTHARGAGVEEIIKGILENDLSAVELDRHHILLGVDEADQEVFINPRAQGILIAGTSGSGKSTALTGLLERLTRSNYQFGLIDPEGDFELLENAVSVGNSHHAPTADEAAQHLKSAEGSVVVNLLGIPLADRPNFLATFLPLVKATQDSFGRPHCFVIDEAHHMLSREYENLMHAFESELSGVILVTVHPEEIVPSALKQMDHAIILGQQPDSTLARFAEGAGHKIEKSNRKDLDVGEALFWQKGRPVKLVKLAQPAGERRRHLRKYAEGDVGREKSFFFTGKDNKLNLRVQNLILFIQIAEGIDDETWLYHLRKAEYSKWFAVAIKDNELAEKTAAIEEDQSLNAKDSKEAIQKLIKERYTASAVGLQLNSDNVLI